MGHRCVRARSKQAETNIIIVFIVRTTVVNTLARNKRIRARVGRCVNRRIVQIFKQHKHTDTAITPREKGRSVGRGKEKKTVTATDNAAAAARYVVRFFVYFLRAS